MGLYSFSSVENNQSTKIVHVAINPQFIITLEDFGKHLMMLERSDRPYGLCKITLVNRTPIVVLGEYSDLVNFLSDRK